MTHAISASGIALLQEFEGFRATPGQLPNGAWVVGYGHVRAEPGEPVTQSEATDLLSLDIAPFEKLVNERVTQPLTQSQFDAAVCFAFSIGAEAFEQSQVLRRINAGEFVAAACAMDAWRKADVNGDLIVLDTLVRRRAAEKALFLKGGREANAASAFLRPKLDYAASVLGAPVTYAPAPEVGSIPVAQPKPEPVARLTEILKSEPATEALLLTQVVPEAANDESEDEEIVTAHAKPNARKIESADTPLPIDRRISKLRAQTQPRFNVAGFSLPRVVENFGLAALLVFGFALIAVAASLVFSGTGAFSELAGAAGLATPGLAAVLIAAFGMWRTPQPPKPAVAN